MTPLFNCICVTYGRTAHLSEAVAAFLSQDYKNACLVIYNTCPEQKIKFVHEQVFIVNCVRRPESLGQARNYAMAQAKMQPMDQGPNVIAVWDDDDIALPNHLSTLANYFGQGIDYVWLDKQWYAEKNKIVKIMPGSAGCFAFTFDAWHGVGGYSELTVGEDRQFIGNVTTKFQGIRATISPKDISFIYNWDNGSFHTSGKGMDVPGTETAHDRLARDLNRRIAAGTEPTGEITIEPHFNHDWAGMVKAHLEKFHPKEKRLTPCVVMLGRYGDIINILPFLKHVHDNYEKPVMMVSKEFESVLDGVSYVERWVVDLNNNQLNEALELGRAKFKFVICAQIWGKNFQQTRNAPAYNMESWNNCGMLNRFNDKTMLPVFDLRNIARESDLVRYATGSGKHKIILVKLGGGVSSPFHHGERFLKMIGDAFGERFRIVDISNLALHRIYDLIGLMDVASCLLTTDSAPLHLAAASKVPVVALVNPLPWQGTEPRCNVVRKLTYAQAERQPNLIISAIEAATLSQFAPVVAAPPSAATARQFQIWHAVMIQERKAPHEKARVALAQSSWEAIYDNTVLPAHYSEYKRTADKEIGDPRDLPYLKDVLRASMEKSSNLSDIIMWTNDDIWIHPELPDLIRHHVSIYGVCTSRRCEIHAMLPPDATPGDYAKASAGHMGRDLFAATHQWLVENWNEIPDAILGASRFDLILAYLVRLYHGVSPAQVGSLDAQVFPAELPVGYIAHVKHDNYWSKKDNADSPSENHNKRLYDEFVKNTQ